MTTAREAVGYTLLGVIVALSLQALKPDKQSPEPTACASPSDEAAYNQAHGISAATAGRGITAYGEGDLVAWSDGTYLPTKITYSPPAWQGYQLSAGVTKPALRCPMCGLDNQEPSVQNEVIIYALSPKSIICCHRCGVLYVPTEIKKATDFAVIAGPLSRSATATPQCATQEWR